MKSNINFLNRTNLASSLSFLLGILGFTALATSCSPARMTWSQLTIINNQTAGQTIVQTGPCPGSTTPLVTFTPGIQASLYYLPVGQSPYNSLADYFINGIHSTQSLNFSNLNVPSQPYGNGFPDPASPGGVVRDDNQNVLTQNYAFQLKSDLVLGDQDAEGDYQFAIMADDGAILTTYDLSSQGDQILNIDGVHPTMMGCATRAVHMTRGVTVPMSLQYYQGPLYEIALTVMWRKVDGSAASLQESLCGTYFDFDSAASANLSSQEQQIIADGWKVLANQNYRMPGSTQVLGCSK